VAQRIEQIVREVAEERRLRGTRQVALSADEKKICAAFGTSESNYLAAKADRLRGGTKHMTQRIFAGVALTDDQLAICRSMGTDPAVFAARLKDRLAGKLLILSSQTQGENGPSGIIGPPIVAEAFQEHRDEIEDTSIDSRRLVMEARKSIDEFLAKSGGPDVWKVLARAAALLVGALDRVAPAYADRVNPRANTPGRSDSQWL
jgi:hypothetical protein